MTPTNEEILRGNRVIAEAMGATIKGEPYGDRIPTAHFITALKVPTLDHDDYGDAFMCDELYYCAVKHLEFHSSWDWLMIAIEKIRDDMDIDTYDEVFLRLYDLYAGNYYKGKKQTIVDIWHSVVKYFESKK